jgi:L,D-peptidoglycan transpeptidase YkuD (ErfK/YbiS/YcfS/YnhG family)
VIDWFGAFVAAFLLAVGGAAAPPATTAAPEQARLAPTSATRVQLVLDGVRVALPVGSRQAVTVNRTSGTHARIALWQQETGTGAWRQIARSARARIGYGGLVRPRVREQGSGTTPLGTYRLLWSFGRHPTEPGWRLTHRTIAPDDYWVQDNRSAYYNRYRNKAEGGFRWSLPQGNVNSSELLTDFAREYEYSIVTSFNYAAQVRMRGAGIFLHVNGGGPTAGCVSAPRSFLRTTLATLDPDLRPVIAIGR